ncbi:MAG: DnaA ATPase domain-containing protein [Thermoguttaceae bacterium]
MQSEETKVLPLFFQAQQKPYADVKAPQNSGFIVGPENPLIETAVSLVLEDDANPANSREVPLQPVTFYGPTGCGKTHVVTGLLQKWKKQQQNNKKAIFLAGADFARQYVRALDSKTIDDFRIRIRRTPLMIIDSLDDLATKPIVQEELLHTLDDLVASGHKVVFTLSQFPGEASFLLPPLAARLIGGLTVPIELPGQKTRATMLSEIAAQQRLAISVASINFLAKNLILPYPALCGTVSQMVLESGGRALNYTQVRRFLKERSEITRPNMNEILRQCARHFSLKQSDLKGKSRKSTVARARAIAICLARQLTGESLKEIGEFFGGRDHKTIAHHCEETEMKIASDTSVRADYTRIRETVLVRPRR